MTTKLDEPSPSIRHPLLQHWRILFLAVCTAALTGPGQTIGVSVFIDPFVEDLELSRSTVSLAYLIGTGVGALAMPMVGHFLDRRGVRVAQVVVGVLFAGALVNMSAVNGVVWLAIGFTGIRMFGQGSLSMISTVTVQLSFGRSRGRAIGVFAMASSGLMALVPLLLNASIDQVGWRDTWLLAALVIALTVIPIGWFGLRSIPLAGEPPLDASPSSVSTAGGAVASPEGGGGVSLDRSSFDRKEAIVTPAFWVLAAMSSLTGMLATGLNFHQIDLLGEAGLSSEQAAAMFLPQVAGSITAGLVVGAIVDQFNPRLLPALTMLGLAGVHLLAAVVTPGAVVLLYALSLGAIGGAVRATAASLLPLWFGTGHIGSIQGVLTLINVAGSALGPYALAVLEGGFDAYTPALLVLLVLPLAVAVPSFAVRPPEAPLPVGP